MLQSGREEPFKAEFGVFSSWFWSYFDLVFHHYAPFFLFGLEMYILCYFMLEACDLVIDYGFTVKSKITFRLRRGFGLL